MCNVPAKAVKAPASFDRQGRDNDANIDQKPFDPQEGNNQSSAQAGSHPVFRNLSRPPTPPPGYTWYVRTQWALAPISQRPDDTVQPSETRVEFDNEDERQNQLYTGRKSLHNNFVTSHAGNGHVAETIALPAYAPSPSIKNEDPVNGRNLYNAEDAAPAMSHPPAHIKVEDQTATVTQPYFSGHSHQPRVFRCLACPREFKTNKDLRNHVQSKPIHQGKHIKQKKQKQKHQRQKAQHQNRTKH
jgi:hypothetical protein